MQNKSNIRQNVVQRIKKSLVSNSDSLDLSDNKYQETASMIEDYIYKLAKSDQSSKFYREKSRDIISNLQKIDKIPLKKDLIMSKITIEQYLNQDNLHPKGETKRLSKQNSAKKIFEPPKIRVHSRKNSHTEEPEIHNSPPQLKEKKEPQEEFSKKENSEPPVPRKVESQKVNEEFHQLSLLSIENPENVKIKDSNDEICFEKFRVEENKSSILEGEKEEPPRMMKKNNSFSSIKSLSQTKTLTAKVLELELKQKEDEALIKAYREEIQRLKQENSELKSERIQLQMQVKQSEIDSKVLKEKIKKQQGEIESLRKINENHDSNYHELNEKIEKRGLDFESKMKKFTFDLNKLTNKFETSGLNSISSATVAKAPVEIAKKSKTSLKPSKTQSQGGGSIFDSMNENTISFSSFINQS